MQGSGIFRLGQYYGKGKLDSGLAWTNRGHISGRPFAIAPHWKTTMFCTELEEAEG